VGHLLILDIGTNPFCKIIELTLAAIFYNLANSSIDAARGKHDYLNAIGAGAVSGAIYKSTGELSAAVTLAVKLQNGMKLTVVAGVRPALVGATIVSAAAGGWSYFKTVV
jgi:import inner membrane translocase subunit TIM23